MLNKPLLAVVIGLCSLTAAAQNTVSYNCLLGGDTRRVDILYEPGVKVPCEVHYYKDTEAAGERQVLWSASHQEGFCEEKAREFVMQLETWGWDCGDVSAAAVPPGSLDGEVDDDTSDAVAPGLADDTDALAPAETEPAAPDDQR